MRKLFASSDSLFDLIRNGEDLTLRQQLQLTFSLSLPAMLAQVSAIVMEYIDASMVGSLGANASASIGLVATSMWLFGSLGSAVSTGFGVQIAHLVGGNDFAAARSVVRQSLVAALCISALVSALGAAISGGLPQWLGGGPSITADAANYFFIFSLTLPLYQMVSLGSSILRCAGNMAVPGVLNVLMCLLDVVFNFYFIFPSRTLTLFGSEFIIPGAGLGVVGAAWGSAAATCVVALLMIYVVCFRSSQLRLNIDSGSFRPKRRTLQRAAHIGFPMAVEHTVLCGAQVVSTIIVAPLGTLAIAANSFAVTAESLCYMPGFGIADAATTLVGQSLGANRPALMKRFAHITIATGIVVMTAMGVVMYFAAPTMMAILTPIEAIRDMGVSALRIEAFAEPMFAASIVTYGVFVGVGDTIIPALMNLGSIWIVRLSLAALLAPQYGLNGVWIAMCAELIFRGTLFLLRLRFGNWTKQHKETII